MKRPKPERPNGLPDQKGIETRLRRSTTAAGACPNGLPDQKGIETPIATPPKARKIVTSEWTPRSEGD